MRSKYKTGLLRANLLVAAALVALRAITADAWIDAILLGTMTAWLIVTSVRLPLGHRRLTVTLWQLLPGLLLAALLWAAPERHIAWIWVWAILLMWPQPPGRCCFTACWQPSPGMPNANFSAASSGGWPASCWPA
ncbi:hypothetical protein A8U91_01240 [Halomonas elongata]|uniref:Uncharacterized protein n=1 Tax=Halomonas elongata TaxID=2746 RepID=A0A1B8P3W4_HALEL|nr:hypothetical protein [Halomonas elongata]OBX36893.1 hypothetical protein A8U91_01240 [Halomonas elongata]